MAASAQASVSRRNWTTISAWARSSSTTRTRMGSGIEGSATEDSGDFTPQGSEKTADRARCPLLQRSAMDGTALRRDSVSGLEVFGVGWASIDRPHVRHTAQLFDADPGRSPELPGRQCLCDALHEVGPDGKGDPRAVRFAGDRRRLIEPDPDTGDDGGGKPDEPRIVIIVGRSGLSADGSADPERARGGAGPTLDDVA